MVTSRAAERRNAFRPDLVSEVVTEIARDGDRLRKVYNRLPCQAPSRSAREDEDMAIHGFRETENMASARPVRLESISLDMPDSDDAQPGLPDRPVTEICFAYHTKDGRWHGRLEPVKTVHDDDAKMSRVTLEVGASNVDIVGVVVYSGFVSMLSYVARPE